MGGLARQDVSGKRHVGFVNNLVRFAKVDPGKVKTKVLTKTRKSLVGQGFSCTRKAKRGKPS